MLLLNTIQRKEKPGKYFTENNRLGPGYYFSLAAIIAFFILFKGIVDILGLPNVI